jgi:arginyl-tRNA synthetase
VNHVGDWGTQFGMLITHLREEYPDFMERPPNITDLTAFYKAAKQRFDDDADFKERARLGVVELQSGNPQSR